MRRHAIPTLALLTTALGVSWLATPAEPDAPRVAERNGGTDGSSAEPQERAKVTLSDGPVPAPGLNAPPGFEVTVFAGDELVHNAYSLTTDADGRVAVSGPGYIRLLVDRNDDGRADEAVPFADGPKQGAQGMCFDGRDLLAVGDGGLLRYRDENGDHRADGPPTTLLPLKTGGEHHAHAIRRGPDGWWYLICGNDTGITAADVTSDASPVNAPQAGVLLRFRYDADADAVSDIQVVADGLRNAYDFDFTASGDPVTYDSDDEREVSLPWYRPTRVFRLTPGSHAGWISRSWKRPDAFPEMPQVLARLGRGSPTGVVVYGHDCFPEPFRNAVFVCDWTFGRVVAIPMNADDEPGEPIEFLAASGSAAFAPTDIEAAPNGSLFISAGGRGTTGTVYRVRPTVEASRGRKPAGNVPSKPASPSPARTRRATLETLADMVANDHDPIPRFDTLLPALADPDTNIRKAAMHVVSLLPDDALAEFARQVAAGGPATVVRFHLGRLRCNRDVDFEGLEAATATLESSEIPSDVRYDAVRLAQLSLGDVGPAPGTPDTFSGYVARADLTRCEDRLAPIRSRLVALFPTGDPVTDEEFVRLLAMLRPVERDILDRLLARVTSESHPTDDLHHLFAAAHLPATRTAQQTRRIADTLVGLDAKLAARSLRLDTNWEERLGDLVAALVETDSELTAAIVRHSEFGRPAHAVLVNARLHSPQLLEDAAAVFLRASDADPGYRWTPEAVSLLGRSHDPATRDRLRALEQLPGVREAVFVALAQRPDERDRPRFVAGLAEPQVEVVQSCIDALEQFEASDDPAELAPLVAALRRLDRDDREYALRNRVAKLLKRAVGDDFGFVFGRDGHRRQPEPITRWVEFARSVAPDAFPEPADDWNAVRQLLVEAETLPGDPMHGRKIYEARACARCHDGAAVGPDLVGVSGRFSREDLFLAISDPDRDVPERYRATLIQTTDGFVVTGLVVYESSDGVTLKDGQKTSRVEADEIELRQPLGTSLMPRGLLKDAAPQDLADLEAYLRNLIR